jgi:hypothetical protein
MADVLVFAMAIASAVALLIVSPREAHRKAHLALKAYAETEALAIRGHTEDFAEPPPDMFTSDLADIGSWGDSDLQNASNQLILNAPSGVAGDPQGRLFGVTDRRPMWWD